MPSRRDVLSAAAGGSLLADVPAARGEPSTPTRTGADAPADAWWPSYRFGRRNRGALPGDGGPEGVVRVAWARDLEAVPAAPAVVPGGVLVAGDAVRLLDAEDGETLWETPLAAPVEAQPVVAGDRVFVGHEAGVAALALADGTVRWSTDEVRTTGPLAVRDGAVFVDAATGIYALDAADGAVRWNASPVDTRATAPAVGRDGVYFSGERLVSLAVDTGARRWIETPPKAQYLGPLAVADGRVFGAGPVDEKTAVVAAYDAASGERLWATDLETGPDAGIGVPVVADDVLVAAGGLHTLDADTGEAYRTVTFDRPVETTPAVAEGVAYLPASDREVAARHLGEMEALWTLPLDGRLATPPAVGEGAVYVADDEGTLYAIRSAARERTPTEVPTFDYEWVDSWAPFAGVLGGAHVLAPLVLGGLVGLASLLRGRSGDEE